MEDEHGWEAVKLYADVVGTDSAYLTSEAVRYGVSPAELVGTFERALIAFDPTPEFEHFGSFPPGWLDLRVFDQTVWWVDVFRRPHRISSREHFHDDHLINVIAYLRTGAQRFHDEYFAYADQDSCWPDAHGWLHHTNLMGALAAEFEHRELGG
ncbi:hypothetical protein ASF62_10920 [Leifsonia sp. Leaf325]|nr:hypothetical protein [Leifsonia sp. Leaf325]KQQ94573.1 hypothetical protein ASF62_10920 [Leifsonia sp. Leaf325]